MRIPRRSEGHTIPGGAEADASASCRVTPAFSEELLTAIAGSGDRPSPAPGQSVRGALSPLGPTPH